MTEVSFPLFPSSFVPRNLLDVFVYCCCSGRKLSYFQSLAPACVDFLQYMSPTRDLALDPVRI